MFMYKELKKQKSNSKLQIGILIAQLAESEVRLKEVQFADGLKYIKNVVKMKPPDNNPPSTLSFS